MTNVEAKAMSEGAESANRKMKDESERMLGT